MLRGRMNRNGKLHALLSTARVANIPSVVSNVWLGVVIGLGLNSADSEPALLLIPWWAVWRLVITGVLLYIAGNFLNDWMDCEWDVKNRPERALPRRLFKKGHYLSTAIALALAGLGLATSVNGLTALIAALILVCIVIYTIWHKRGAWTVVPMGLCRGFLPMMGALGMVQSSQFHGNSVGTAIISGIAGSALFCYIMGLSLRARYESRDRPPEMPGTLFVIAGALLMIPFLWNWKSFPLAFLGIAPYCLWLWRCQTANRKPISRYVSSLLAGIPLVDWILLMPLSLLMIAESFSLDAISVTSFTLPPLAFISALLLQRLAPAT